MPAGPHDERVPRVKDEFPELQKVDLDRFIDSSILRQLDQSGFIDRLSRP